MDLLPAVVTMGVTEFQHGLGRCWRELESGAVVHVMNKRSRLHRGWLVPELPQGFQAEPVTCNQVRDNLGMVFEAVRDGAVFEIRDTQGAQPGRPAGGTVRGYLMLTAPEGIARLDAALQFASRSRTGRVRLRDIWPAETAARP